MTKLGYVTLKTFSYIYKYHIYYSKFSKYKFSDDFMLENVFSSSIINSKI